MPWLKAEATYFARDLKNMISLQPVNRASQYVNLGEIEVEGFEFELKADISDDWYTYFNYTNQELTDKQKYLEGTDSSPNPTFGLDVPNVPNQYASAGIEYKNVGLFRQDALLKLFWETVWVDEYFYGWELSRFQDRKIDAQISHTAGFEYSFHNDEIIIGFEVRNLTDEENTDVFNFPLMGRSYHFNLRYTWFN
jgi:outer membrane receptor protein involved in Fe transport